MLGDSNTLISSSYSYSANSVIGSALGYTNDAPATVNGLTAALGNSNALIPSSFSYSALSSSSNVIGAVAGLSNRTSAIVPINDLTARFGNDNILSVASSFSVSSFIRAAIGNGTGMANAVTVNMNDNQTLSAIASSLNPAIIKVNTFGADNTDK
jgi:hypothetical protein